MQASKDLFVVSSALMTSYGLLPTQERVEQTLQTLASIRKHAPEADIVVLELSRERIPEDYEALFAPYQPKHIVHFANEPTIKRHYEQCSVTHDPVGNQIKNLNEIAAMQVFLEWGIQQHYFAPYRRVFKLSGRYQLCEPFDLAMYQNPIFTGRCAFLRIDGQSFDTKLSGCMPYLYVTRLWSFDVALVAKVATWFEVMLQMLLKRYQLDGYTDIEHLLALVVPPKYCVYVKTLGVKGQVGLDGKYVQE